MRSIRCLMLVSLIAAAFALPAFADDGEVDDDFLSIGPRAAYFDPKEDGADSVWFGGAQLRAHFGILALEGSIDYREVDAGPIDVQTYPVQASLLAYLIENKPVSIYLLGGGGWYFTRIDAPSGFDDQTEDNFGVHAGAGVEAWIADNVSIDADYRYLWVSKIDFDDASLVDRDYDPSGSMITMAVNFFL
jgi:opacity protein-like surface antigen